MIESYLDQLHRLAERRGVPLAEAAAAAGVSQTTLLRWRLGKNEPKHATVVRIAKAMEQPADAARRH